MNPTRTLFPLALLTAAAHAQQAPAPTTTVNTAANAASPAPGDVLIAARTATPVMIPGVAGPLALDMTSLVVLPNRRGLDTDLARKLAGLRGQSLAWQRLERTEQGWRLTPALTVQLHARTQQVDDEAACRARATRFVGSLAGNAMVPGWDAPQVGAAQPVYRPDVAGAAYYEFRVAPRGYVVVSTGEHDRPIAQFDHAGTPPSEVLQRAATAAVARVYKLDSLSYVAEDVAGVKVAQLNAHPNRLVPTADGRSWQQEEWRDWAELKAEYRSTFLPFLESLRMDAAIAWLGERQPAMTPMDWSAWSYWWAGGHEEQCNYGQWSENGCAVGCGPVAWAMLIGWIDRRSTWDWRWRNHWGIYRSYGGYGADALAPRYYWEYGFDGVNNIIRELRNRVATFCMVGQGATAPWDMGRASSYLAYRSPGWVRANYNAAGIPDGMCNSAAETSIKSIGTPVILGTGWLTHYPLGYIFAERWQQVWWWVEYQKWIWVNQGWYGADNCWVDASTWFAGEILR